MARRNRLHAIPEARGVDALPHWLTQQQSQFQGEVLSGEAETILAQNPDTTVGIDAAVLTMDVLRNQRDETE